mgnify:CR=1 FL=1
MNAKAPPFFGTAAPLRFSGKNGRGKVYAGKRKGQTSFKTIKAGGVRHEKRQTDGAWARRNRRKKALEEKLRRRVYTAAFEAAQQRKEKPWQSWDEAFSERLAKQPFITEEERKPFAPSGAGAQKCLLHRGQKAAVARAFGGKRGRGRRAG